MNVVIVTGNLGKDARPQKMPDGAMRAVLEVACESRYRDREGRLVETVNWFDVYAYGALGARCCAQLKKGARVHVRGELRHARWTAPEGAVRYACYILADDVMRVVPLADLPEANAEQPPDPVRDAARPA